MILYSGLSEDMAPIIIAKLKLYLDTTIPNYLFADHYPDRKEITRLLVKAIRNGEYEGYISDVVFRELSEAPEPLLSKMVAEVKDFPRLQSIDVGEELAQIYIKNEIFTLKYIDDARHVAIATLNNMDAVVSWNFGHLVNIQKILKVNAVNESKGYKHMEIVSPQEVIYGKD